MTSLQANISLVKFVEERSPIGSRLNLSGAMNPTTNFTTFTNCTNFTRRKASPQKTGTLPSLDFQPILRYHSPI